MAEDVIEFDKTLSSYFGKIMKPIAKVRISYPTKCSFFVNFIETIVRCGADDINQLKAINRSRRSTALTHDFLVTIWAADKFRLT
jgi:hypothetical protein